MVDLNLRSVSVALSLLLAPSIAMAEDNDRQSLPNATTDRQRQHDRLVNRLKPDSAIGEILYHSAFMGFARQILPWDSRAYDAEMPIRNIGSLLPYHSRVDPKTVVGALNRLIDDTTKGERIFYDIYTEDQKRSDPTKANTGLFFIRGHRNAPFAVIAPGGGFAYVGSVHEGFPYAVDISGEGYNAFVLKYRAGQGGTIATEDLAAAISFIFREADALGVGIEHYALWGSSAGARMAASIGSHGVAAFGGDDRPKPSTVVMAYTAHSDIADREPATFVVVGENDRIAPPASMEPRVTALRRHATPVEYRVYKDLGHGFGRGTATSAEGWIVEATRFWERNMRSTAKP